MVTGRCGGSVTSGRPDMSERPTCISCVSPYHKSDIPFCMAQENENVMAAILHVEWYTIGLLLLNLVNQFTY